MNIDEINQYSHKILKIDIENPEINLKSSETKVVIKIHIDKQANETIRFSKTKNPLPNEWIDHQSQYSDYFIRIDNKPKTITHVYAHFFPASLYNYTEVSDIFSVYDFSDFTKEKRTNKWDGKEYPLQITSYGYEMVLGYNNKPLIRSLLNNSITRYKDPNYKNYIQTNLENSIDMTEKGRFPLSSRYRNSLYRTAPIFNDNTTFTLPHWQANNIQYSHGATPQPRENGIETGYEYENNTATDNYVAQYGDSGQCKQREAKIPFWEAKIHRSGLSPWIDDTPEDAPNYTPINVYLNYQYLPTSTEYHQHYFGFEKKNIKDKYGNTPEAMLTAVESYKPDGTYDAEQTQQYKQILEEYCEKINNGTYKQLSSNKNYEVLDGEELNNINQAFGTDDVTYRLIRHGNPFDSSNAIYVNHKNIYDIDLDRVSIKNNCLWEKNQCDDYYTYIPTGRGSAYINVTLKENTYYVLKYFMFIPAEAYVEDDSCYMQVVSHFDSETQVIGELNDAFKAQDKKLKHQWIYHEIPFYTYDAENKIIIKGPQHNHEGVIGINRKTGEIITELTEDDRNNFFIELHDCRNDNIFFYSVQIAEMVEYSPTIKYTKTGMFLTEGDKYASKNLTDARNDTCVENIVGTNKWSNKQPLNPSDTWIDKGKKQLPIPFTDVYIFFDSDFTIMYNELTTELSYTKGDAFSFKFVDFNKDFDTELKWLSNDSLIKLQYDRKTNPESEAAIDQLSTNRTGDSSTSYTSGELSLFSAQSKVFTTGINNNFSLRLQDSYGHPIQKGEVECSIWTSNKEEDTPCGDAKRCLKVQTPDENGIVKYERLNFKNFTPSKETYYLRVKYRDSKCYNKEITKWKTLKFVEERRNIEVFANKYDDAVCLKDEENNPCFLVGSSIFNEDEYENTSTIYIIKHVDEYPLRLDAKIRAQPINGQEGNIIDEGYCELSVNDKVIQTTFVDKNGVANFYLDEFDLDPGMQTIKIEYFTEPYDSINYTYFHINCDTGQGYDERPAIPIRINQITQESVTQLSTGIFELPKDDMLLINIDTGDNKDFSITKKKNDDPATITNITEVKKDMYIITAMYDKKDQDKYIITTGNLKNEDTGEDTNDLYRTYKKEFIVKWT